MNDQRLFTFADVRMVSMFARLEGAPATAEELIADLDARGKLSAALPLPSNDQPKEDR